MTPPASYPTPQANCVCEEGWYHSALGAVPTAACTRLEPCAADGSQFIITDGARG